MLIGQLLRECSFHAVEALVRSSARRALSVSTTFGDDALGYFTERLDPAPTRAALVGTIRQAKHNKAFDDSRFLGLAVDGTATGRSRRRRRRLCRPVCNAKKQVNDYRLQAGSFGGCQLEVDCRRARFSHKAGNRTVPPSHR